MSKYPAYSEYKPTRLGWLQQVPAHWEVKRLKYLGEAIIGLTYSPDDVVDREDGTLVLRSSNVQNKKLAFEDNVYVNKLVPEKLKTQLGDILICARNGSRALIGKNAQIDEGAVGMTFGAFMSVFRSPYNNYLSKVFNSALFEYQSGSFLTATINQLTTANLNSFEIPLPPDSERITISNFLFHETAKIDTLIEKQQQLIKLLKEKRQAVISHAVTKGLNPEAPMKDSGVEWLGDVPEHWVVKKLKYLVSEPLLYGANEAAEEVDKSQPRFVRITDVKSDGTLKEDTFRSLPKNVALPYMLKDGDILLARSGGTVGKSFIYRDSWGSCCFAGYLIKASINEDIVAADWVYFNTLTSFYWDWIQGSQIQATIQNVSAEKYNLFQVAIPPKEECKIITNFIFENLNKFDELTKKAERAILLMRERRTALISAAVTGKIDVRDWRSENESYKVNTEVLA